MSGTIGLAERVGRAQREALAAGDPADVAAAVAAAGGGLVVFGGTVASYEWRDADGFTVGDTVLHGAGEHAGSSAHRLWFKNENLMKLACTAPPTCSLPTSSASSTRRPAPRRRTRT